MWIRKTIPNNGKDADCSMGNNLGITYWNLHEVEIRL